MNWFKRATSFLNAIAWTICSSNNGVKSATDGQHPPTSTGPLPAAFEHYSTGTPYQYWNEAFQNIASLNIDPRFHKDAKTMMETQYRYLHKNFTISEQDNQMAAVVYAYLISKLIIWDICGVQAFTRPISEVRVLAMNSLGGYIPKYPVIECDDFRSNNFIRHDSFSLWNEKDIDSFTDELAADLNNNILNVMFNKTGRPKTFRYGGDNRVDTSAELIAEYEKESQKIYDRTNHATANWLLVTEDVRDLIFDSLDISSLGEVESFDRANIIVYNIKVSGMQLMVFYDDRRVGESYIGFTDMASNDHAPIIFTPYVLLKLDGTVSTSKYIIDSSFGCVEHSLRKKMIKKINVINEDKNEI